MKVTDLVSISMANSLVFGNWKMHGSTSVCRELIQALVADEPIARGVEVAVFPTALHLADIAGQLENHDIKLGAQNFYPGEEGAFTGEISGSMLRELGVSHVLVGHSERREIFAESDSLVADKLVAALEHGLTPVLCVGETLEQRESGETQKKVGAQLDAVLQKAGIEALASTVIAYEPIWAIGTGKTATPEQAQEVHGFIRSYLAASDQSVAENVKILYGGSVKASNARELFSQPDINGGLVGGASLVAEEFISICKSAE